MSYDLMVFDPAAAPKKREEFLAWYDELTEWGDEHGYDDPIVTTIALRAWFMDMIGIFPAMNGPYSASFSANSESRLADYSIEKSAIYIGFSWSVAEEAHETVAMLAAKHGVGFFDVSSDKGAVYVPDESGNLSLLHEQ